MEAGFLTLQSCMNNIMETDGSNNCKIEHKLKEKLQCLGLLPRLTCITDYRCLFDNNYQDIELDENMDSTTDDSIMNVSVAKEDSTVTVKASTNKLFATTMENKDVK